MAGRRNGPHEGKKNGRKPRLNRYNPNAPDWRAVNLPPLFRMLVPTFTPTKANG